MRKPVRMKKLKILLHRSKKDPVLQMLFDEGIFEPEDIEIESDREKEQDVHVVVEEVMSLLSKIGSIKEIFTEVGFEVGGEEESSQNSDIEKMNSKEIIGAVDEKLKEIEGNIWGLYNGIHENKKEAERINDQLMTLKVLKYLNLNHSTLKEARDKDSAHTHVEIGTAPTAEVAIIKSEILKKSTDAVIIQHPLSELQSLIFIIAMKQQAEDVGIILNLHSFKKLDLPGELYDFEIHDAIPELEDRLIKLDVDEEEILRELKKIALSEKKKLNIFQELLEYENQLDGIVASFGQTAETYVLQGWVPADSVKKVSDMIMKTAEDLAIIQAFDPGKKESPPTLLKNPKMSEPLEMITGAYGTPAYDEYDPTSLVGITFPLIFGFMFGDVGQGLVIAIIGYYIGFRMDAAIEIKKAGRIIMLAGIAAMLVGFLYGAVFSIEGLFEPLWLSPVHAASENMNVLLGAALKFGVLIMVIAMLANVMNEVAHHKYAEAFVNKYGVSGIWLILGGAIMISKHGTDLGGIVTDYTLFIPLVFLPVFIIFIGAWKIEGEPLPVAIVDAIFEALVKFLVNTISFMRIVILALIHGALSLIMVGVMDIMPPTTAGFIGKVAVFLIMNIVIIVMELFVSFIQTMRLHYYEIFSKFYSGTGHQFSPLKFKRKYT